MPIVAHKTFPSELFAHSGITSFLENSISAYDEKAKIYEKLISSQFYNKIIWGTSPKDYKLFANEAIAHSKGYLLDVGCGGLAHSYKYYHKTSFPCILLDNSLKMLKIAQERLSTLGSIPQNIKLIQANAFQIPFCSSSFDTVCSFGMLHLFDNKLRFLDECLRVLKSGGSFYFSVLVSDRLLGKFYMSLLTKEFANPSSEYDILKLFRKLNLEVKSWRKGNMLFLKGVKNMDIKNKTEFLL